MTKQSAVQKSSARTKRANIIREAAALFDRHGYHSTSMDDLAQAVGLSKPTLYHHFRSKDDILFFIHEEMIEFNISREEERNSQGLSASQQILEIVRDIFEMNETHPGYVRVFFEHYRELPLKQQRSIQVKRGQYRDLVQGVIQRGLDAGEFRGVDPRLATLFLLGASNSTYQWFQPDGAKTPRELAHVFWDFLMRGMLQQTPSTAALGAALRQVADVMDLADVAVADNPAGAG